MLMGTAALTGLLLFIYFGNSALKVISTLLWVSLGFAVGFLLGGASFSPLLSWLGAILMGLVFGYGAWHGHQVVRFISGGLIPIIALIAFYLDPGSQINIVVVGGGLFVGAGLVALKWPKALHASYASLLALAVMTSWSGSGAVLNFTSY